MVGTNLLLDGWTSAFQDGIRHKYPHTSPLHIMLGMNSLVAIFTIAAQSAVQVLARVPFLPALRWTPLTVSLAFFRRHPKALWHLALVTGTGVAGQLFIFLLIAIFGTLTCSTVTTTRKFFSILASVIVNQNPLTRHQWMGVFGVFSGISLKTYSKAFASKPKAADEIVKPAAAVASAGPRTGGIKSENGISKDGVSNGANGVGSKKDS